jgi:hypothetical protein
MTDSDPAQGSLAASFDDTGRTLGWKMILEAAKLAATQDEGEKAERLYKHALDKAEHRLGSNHIIISYLLMEFAEFYFAQDEYGNAHLLHTRAREILGSHVDDAHSALQ